MVKVTYSLDEATVAEIRRTAERLGRAQSQVVREAVAEYAARADRVSERERLHALGILEKLRQAGSRRAGR
jgi:predicted transcriptional regulator